MVMDNAYDSALVEIGAQLKALRKQHYPADDQAAFAVRLGVSRNTYRSMESGRGKVAFETYLKAAHLYGVHLRLLDVFVSASKRNLFEELDAGGS